MDNWLNRKIQLMRNPICQSLHRIKGLLYLLFSQIQTLQSVTVLPFLKVFPTAYSTIL